MTPAAPANTTLLIVANGGLVSDRLVELVTEVPGLTVVGTATDAGEAVALVSHLHPHVVIVDLQVRDAGGLDLVRRIRSADDATILLALAAWRFIGLDRRCAAAGATAVFVLPGDLDALIAALISCVAAQEGGVHDSPVSS